MPRSTKAQVKIKPIVAHDQDVLDFQYLHRVLYHRKGIQVRVYNLVGHVAVHKDLKNRN